MSLPYDLRDLVVRGKPIWRRFAECIFALSDQIDALDGGSSSVDVSALTSRIEALEEKVEELENA